MIIKRTTLYQVVIYLILFLNLGFLNFRSNVDTYSEIFSAILSVFLFMIYMSQKQKKIIYSWINYYIFFVFILLAIEFFRIYFYPTEIISLTQAVQMYSSFAVLLLVYPLNEILNADSDISQKFLKGVCILGYIALIYRAFLWGMYNFLNINIAPGMFITDWTRSLSGVNFVRLSGTFLDGYTIVYSWIHFFYKKQYKYILGLIFILFFIIFIIQSRAAILEYVLITIFLLFINSVQNKNRIVSVATLVLFLVVIILSNFSLINSFFDTFSVNNSQYGASTYNRLNGLNYYHDLWLNSNFWFGIGFLPDQLRMSQLLTFYLADYNILINLYEFGVLGFIILIFPILKGVYVFLKNINNVKKNYIIFLQVGLIMYVMVISFVQNVYWVQTILIVPILISLILFVEEHYNLRKNSML